MTRLYKDESSYALPNAQRNLCSRTHYVDDDTLRGADLYGADLKNTKGLCYQIPQEGALIVWKALAEGVIAKIQIPAKAKRTGSIVGRKCRAEYVKVLEIIGGNGESGSGLHDGTEYKVGKIVRPDRYDDDPRVECTHGIHFFLTREEAEEYIT